MPENKIKTDEPTQIDASKSIVGNIYDNTRSDIIQITTDKLHNILVGYRSELGGNTAWHAPAGLLASTLAALLTSSFKDFLGLGGAFWQALFVIVMLISAVWLIWAIFRAYKARTIEQVINKIKNT